MLKGQLHSTPRNPFMHSVITTLMREHRVIESVLSVLSEYARSIAAGGPSDRDTVQNFSEFFTRFADRYHHGKEEDLLFAAMARHGMPTGRGPLGVMLAEHDEGRRHVRVFTRIAQGSGPLSEEERTAFVDAARAFVPLLGNHIAKEDNVLYPMALRLLPEDVLGEMIASFDRFELQATDRGERIDDLAERLTGTQPQRSVA